MLHRIAAWIALLLSFASAPGSAHAFDRPVDLASLAGEVLEFRIRWGLITAGNAKLEVVPEKGGRLRFRATATSLPFIEKIYPVQELIESSVSPAGAQVIRYYKRAKEGWRDPREDEVLFDLRSGIARSFHNGALRRNLNVPAGVQDPLSCFYRYRTTPVTGDEPIVLDVTDGNRLITGTVAQLGRETVETPAGTFRTVLVEPKIEGIGGIFRKSPGARILVWLTDDDRRRPVKLQSKVIIGHFTAELLSFRP